VSALFASAPTDARAQADVARFERQLEQVRRETLLQVDQGLSLDQRAFFDYGGYVTLGYLSAEDNNDDTHTLRQYDLLGYARLNLDGVHEFFLRARTGYRDFNPGDSFISGRGDEPIDFEFDRWFYRFDYARYRAAYFGEQIDWNLVLKGGRDLYIWGNGVALSVDLEGVAGTLSWGGNDLTVLAGVTPTRTVDFDASRPAFDHNTRRGFYGVQLSRQIGDQVPFVYGLLQRDYNQHDTLVTGPVTTKFDYNSYYLGVGSSGAIGSRLLYGVEAVYEGGTNLSNSFAAAGGPFITPIPQTRDQIEAWALDARLDYLLPDVRRSRFSGEVILASGDDDRGLSTNTFNGNKPGTNDRAFNSLGLLNTGLAFAPAVSNLVAVRAGASTFPFLDGGPLRRLQVGADVFFYGKLESDAPIDEPTLDERFLGWEPDLYINWQITSDVTAILRYGIFFPNDNAFRSDEQRQYLYGGITYAF
jgi:hypothetical protein